MTFFTLKKLYEDKQIAFIIEDSDTIGVYEKRGKENADRAMENAVNTITQMDRVQQVELIRGSHIHNIWILYCFH